MIIETTTGASEGAPDTTTDTTGAAGDVETTAEAPPEEVDVFGDKHGVQWLDEFDAREDAPAFKVERKALDELPMPARQVIHNLRKDYQKKTTDLAKKSRDADVLMAQIRKEQAALDKGRAAVLELMSDPEIRKAATPPPEPEGGPPPLHTEEGLQYFIDKQVAARLKEHLDGYSQVAEKKRAALDEQDRAAAKEARKAEVQTFVKATPDFEEYRADVVKIVNEKKIPVEDAYLLAKARRPGDPVEEARSDVRRTLRRPTDVRSALKTPPPGASASELYEFYEANPDAAKEVRARRGYR